MENLKYYQINGQKIPIIHRHSQQKRTSIAEYHGIIEISQAKKDKDTLRTIIKNNKKMITKFYTLSPQRPINRTTEDFHKICEKYLNKHKQTLKVIVNQLKYRTMKLTHLGTAGGRLNNIILNTKLQYMTEEIIEATIYHELCHLWKYQNKGTMKHDKDFFNKLYEKYTPQQLNEIHQMTVTY